MASKGKKGKKKNVKIKAENTFSSSKQEPSSSKNKVSLYTYFNSEEISEIKSILKVKDASGVPYVIGAIILNKFDLLKKLVKQGFNINESGPNNISALIWAVKYKNLEMIDFLISKGADPTIKTENGDNVLIVALEHKSWEEQAYINLWNLVKKVTFVDVNYTSKNGHNLLHIAVRRDWEDFIKILISENVNVNIPNSNGVTPLMLACYRNNINVVNNLLSGGANILKEDNHNRMALCYAISSEIKNSKPPFILIDKVFSELKKFISIKDYIKKIIDIIISISKKSEFSYSTSEMIVYIMQYIVQYINNGAKILMDFKVFEQMAQIINKHTSNQEILKFLLTLALEILFYNDHTEYFNPEILRNIARCFINSDLPGICMTLIKHDPDRSSNILSFYVLVLLSTNNEIGQNWLKEQINLFYPIYEKYIVDCTQQHTFNDEKRFKIMKKKLKKLKRSIGFINTKTIEKQPSVDPVDKEEDKCSAYQENEPKVDSSINMVASNISSSKKTKRRTKAMKAKIAKIKSAELAERLNLTGKKVLEVEHEKVNQLSPKKEVVEEVVQSEQRELIIEEFSPVNNDTHFSSNIHPIENLHLIKQDENPIAYSLLQFLQNENELYFPRKENINGNLLWVNKIQNLPFDCPPFLQNLLAINKEKLLEANETLKKISNNEKSPSKDITTEVNIIIDYLSELLQVIVLKYQNNWENDKRVNCNYGLLDDKGDQKPLESYILYLKQIEKLEKTTVEQLQRKFNQLTTSIRDLSIKEVSECYKSLCTLEATLLKFKIRGRTLLYDICPSETVKILYNYVNSNNLADNGNLMLNFIEDSLNDRPVKSPIKNVKVEVSNESSDEFSYKEFKPDISSDVYFEDMSNISSKNEVNKEKECQMREKTLDDAYHLFHSMATICDSDDEKEDSMDLAARIFLKKCKKEMKLAEQLEKENSSRWAGRIHSLMSETSVQKLLSGDVIISKTRDKYQEYIISQGGNFNPVILGLTSNHQPLAVKQLPKEHSVCKVMKTLINPLLGLRHKYILHYYACDYEGNELILATPLCEFNIGQYVLLLKETSNNLFNLKPIDIVKQFLLGLKYLHVRKDPIVHGNLKPSNIFVDLNGVVKVAEFGTHKALYKTVEAPKSSLIWFSQETYQGYKQTSTVDCTCASDIQVSGMLIYFILSGGVHPYGSDVMVILKNLEKAILNLPQSLDVVLVDIVTWMMMYDPNERPNIEQVLSHVIFWSEERKWRFILNCAGINHHRDHSVSPLDIEINNLHNTIDKMSIQEKINGNWVDVVRGKFPNLCFCGEDSITGLLRFIRYFYENQSQIETREKDLSKYILAYFPGFPLSLYRILDATNWLKHPIFYEYTEIEPILP